MGHMDSIAEVIPWGYVAANGYVVFQGPNGEVATATPTEPLAAQPTHGTPGFRYGSVPGRPVQVAMSGRSALSFVWKRIHRPSPSTITCGLLVSAPSATSEKDQGPRGSAATRCTIVVPCV